MKAMFSILDKPIAFDKSSDFVKTVISGTTGSIFKASTKINVPAMTITALRKARSKTNSIERVLQIPVHNKGWKIVGEHLLLSPDGPRHKPTSPSKPDAGNPAQEVQTVRLISIGGPKAKTTSGCLKIELDATKGKWHVEHDLASESLNISFNRSKHSERSAKQERHST